MDPALVYTFPEDRGKCGFCGGEENGYAKRDANGKWQAACWKCVRPESSSATQVKREKVGTIYTEELEEEKPKVKKNPGIPPSTHRPKVL
jgi:hypothetical protein